MAVSKYLAFDFGAESGRAIIGIFDGGSLHIEEIHRFQNRQTKILGHLRWDVLALFEEMKTGLKLAVQKGHSDIESIGIDTWGVDFGFVGNDNALLGFPYCYRDVRTNGIMEKAFKKISRKELYGITGIQFMQFNSVFQLYSAKRSKDSALHSGGRLLYMPDLFNFMLTGVARNEYTIASTSQLLNAGTKAYGRKIFSSLGLPIKLMAPMVMPGTVIGKLLPEICEETGLRNVDVVAVGCHDTASAIAAVPAQKNNWAYLSSGTWSLLGIETDEPIINEQSLKNNFTNEGGVFGTIRFLKNVMGLWLLQQTRKSFQQQGNACEYDELITLALKSKEFVSILNPDDASFLNPPDMPDAIRTFCRNTRQPVPQTPGEFARCILESLALKYKAVLENITAVTGTSIDQLHVVGGGSKNELLNQFTADACGIPVVAGPVEATAIGNVLVQAIAKKKIGSIKSGREIIAHSFPMKTFHPVKTEQWNEVFRKYQSLFI
ncbi:MAG: rhamnulokinase [Ignavibacteriae bacterium]|nr:MAG: rhamnulokinase [Ignavibacteriota bacterium]